MGRCCPCRVVIASATAVLLLAGGCSGSHPVAGKATVTSTPRATHAPAEFPAVLADHPFCQLTVPCVPRTLWRPLRIPHIRPGAPCPRTPVVQHPRGTPVGNRVAVSPVYAGGILGRLSVELPPGRAQVDFFGSAWGGNKVLWESSPDYRGPLLIRGRQVDGHHLVRFETGAPPPSELELAAGRGMIDGSGWGAWPSYTRVRAPGCYAWQVDGTDFTDFIFFRAVLAIP
jgi:hypothetical protein